MSLQTKAETQKYRAVFYQQPGQSAVKTWPTWPYLNVNYATESVTRTESNRS